MVAYDLRELYQIKGQDNYVLEKQGFIRPKNNAVKRGVTALTRAVSGEKQIYSGNLEILPGIGKPGKFFGKYEIFSGH